MGPSPYDLNLVGPSPYDLHAVVFPAIDPGKPIKVSATTYISYLRCPAQAQARYDEKAFSPETRESFRGVLVHRLIARHLRMGPVDDVERAARAEIGEALNEKMVSLGINKPSLLKPLIAEAAELYRRFCLSPQEGFLEAEITIDHEPAVDVTLTGKIDGVFVDPESGGNLLRDWKTGSLGEPFRQLYFYALLWLLSRGELASVEAASLQTGEKARRTPTLPELQLVAERVAELVNHVRSVWADGVEAAKSAGPWCERCPILATCAEGQGAIVGTGASYRLHSESPAVTTS